MDNPILLDSTKPIEPRFSLWNACSRLLSCCPCREGSTCMKILRLIIAFEQQSVKEIRKGFCNYCLGCCSVFVTVLVSCISFAVLSKAPLLFLKTAEQEHGQVDMYLYSELSRAYNRSIVEENLQDFDLKTGRFSAIVDVYGQNCLNSALRSDFYYDQDILWCPPDTNDIPCFIEMCHMQHDYTSTLLELVDLKAEEKMGFGRTWEWNHMKAGEVVITSSVANRLGTHVHDSISMSFLFEEPNRPLVTEAMRLAGLGSPPRNITSNLWISARVIGIVGDDMQGKSGSSRAARVIMPAAGFLEYAVQYAPPDWHMVPGLVDAISSLDLMDYPTRLFLNRHEKKMDYNYQSYDNILQAMLPFTSEVTYKFGFPQTVVDSPLIEALFDTRFSSLFLGMICNLIIAILAGLSILLIYSLLTVNVDTRTLEIAIRRMLGQSNPKVIGLLLIQAFNYSFPAWCGGLIMGQIVVVILFTVLQDALSMHFSMGLDGKSVLVASLMGLLIPVISSILPIRGALGKSIVLAMQRRTTTAVEIQISRSEGSRVSYAWIISGIMVFFFGALVCYVLPYSLMTLNLTLMLFTIFVLLLSMLFGMLILSLSIEGFVQKCLQRLLFFWESRHVYSMVSKNLVAHKRRNRKSALMFSVSLGIIMFIEMMLESQIAIQMYHFKHLFGDFSFRLDINNPFRSDGIEKIQRQIVDHYDFVEDWAWITPHLVVDDSGSSRVSNLGQYFGANVVVFGATSNFFDVADMQFYLPDTEKDVDLDMIRQLYTISGSQRGIIGTNMKDLVGARTLESPFMVSSTGGRNFGSYDRHPTKYFKLKPMGLLDMFPMLTGMSPFPVLGKDASNMNVDDPEAIVLSLPTFARLRQALNISSGSVDDLGCFVGAFKLKASATAHDRGYLSKYLSTIYNHEMEVFDYQERKASIDDLTKVLDILFSTAGVIALTLCFFSLLASMTTNVLEQTKEIGVLRSLGFTNFEIGKTYLEEALVLIMSATFIGVAIGWLLGFTMSSQQSLFAQLPLQIVFPSTLVITVVVGSILACVVATLCAVYDISRRSVSNVLRMRP